MAAHHDWDRYWRFEQFRRRCDPLDFRRWKLDSQRALKGLYPGRPKLLDSTAGLGDHTINLVEQGFDVEACDTSSVARAATREALAAAGHDVEVFDARWQDLGDPNLGRPGRYDLIFNDALHWVYDEAELRAALGGLFAGLRPGGELVYFFADESDDDDDAGQRILTWDWDKLDGPARVLWDHRLEDRRVTLTVVSTRGDDYIDELHLYHDRRGDEAPILEALTVRCVYRWDWHHLTPLLRDVGFVDVRTDHFDNIKGYRFAMNRARRPA